MNALAVIAEPALPVVFRLRQGQQVCGHAEGLQDGLQHLRGVVPRARAKRTAGQV